MRLRIEPLQNTTLPLLSGIHRSFRAFAKWWRSYAELAHYNHIPFGKSTAGAPTPIGGLHGEVTLLRRLLEALVPAVEDTLIFLGDYFDRGEDSLACRADG
jgi:hypothetical protein